MRKFLLLLSIISAIIMCCGCDGGPLYDVHYPKPVVVEPDQDTRYTINGYKDTSVTSSKPSDETTSSDAQDSNEKIIGNRNTKKLHKLECSSVKNLKEESADIFESSEDALLNGYTQCSRCFK